MSSSRKCLVEISIAILLLCFAQSSHAGKACFGNGETLVPMADTELKNADGAELVLAHKTTKYCFLVPYWLTDDGFVLGVKGNDRQYYPLPGPEKLKALQTAGLLPEVFPVWKRSAWDWIEGYFAWWFIAAFLGYRLFAKPKNP